MVPFSVHHSAVRRHIPGPGAEICFRFQFIALLFGVIYLDQELRYVSVFSLLRCCSASYTWARSWDMFPFSVHRSAVRRHIPGPGAEICFRFQFIALLFGVIYLGQELRYVSVFSSLRCCSASYTWARSWDMFPFSVHCAAVRRHIPGPGAEICFRFQFIALLFGVIYLDQELRYVSVFSSLRCCSASYTWARSWDMFPFSVHCAAVRRHIPGPGAEICFRFQFIALLFGVIYLGQEWDMFPFSVHCAAVRRHIPGPGAEPGGSDEHQRRPLPLPHQHDLPERLQCRQRECWTCLHNHDFDIKHIYLSHITHSYWIVFTGEDKVENVQCAFMLTLAFKD